MWMLLRKAERILAPSNTVAELYKRVWPELQISVVPHPEPRMDPMSKLPVPGDPRIVAVVGALLQHKGSNIVEACVRDAQDRKLPLKFVVIGDFQSRLNGPCLEVMIGRFSPPQLSGILLESGAVIGFLPSVWPETYSYVLSEYYRYGLHPVVFNIGAQSERVKAAGYGTIIPLNTGAASINDVLLNVRLDPTPRQPPAGLPEKHYVTACYGSLLPLADDTDGPVRSSLHCRHGTESPEQPADQNEVLRDAVADLR
jgi:hypothetical protein